ncbi:hypothetical protein A9Q99_00155 [Gammaproteobacteria bacterium 45_16_T64]|nr:hypothetical protein A9Q99_00155 [Gammaproteobacteria bacterium 45_16_T64]
MARLIFVLLIIYGLSACTQVKAYQRGTLARPDMAWKPNPLDSALKDHMYFAKEASSGGTQAAGGGCGCN